MTTQQTKVDWPSNGKLWEGGRNPGDWSGEWIMFRSGSIVYAPKDAVWKFGWDHSYGEGDVIAYSVSQPEAPTPSPELTARMVEIPADHAELLRRVLTSIGACVGTTLGGKSVFVPEDLVVEARKAAALFPEPVDPDLIEARKVTSHWIDAQPKQTCVDLALAGIKAGRALAEAGK